MLGYQVPEMQFLNKLPPQIRLQLSIQATYHVQYGANGIARGEMSVSVLDREKEKDFSIKVTLVGVFKTDEIDQQVIHKESFRTLFPYARALISTVTANAGMPPILLPAMDPEGKGVLRVEINPKGNPAE